MVSGATLPCERSCSTRILKHCRCAIWCGLRTAASSAGVQDQDAATDLRPLVLIADQLRLYAFLDLPREYSSPPRRAISAVLRWICNRYGHLRHLAAGGIWRFSVVDGRPAYMGHLDLPDTCGVAGGVGCWGVSAHLGLRRASRGQRACRLGEDGYSATGAYRCRCNGTITSRRCEPGLARWADLVNTEGF